MPVARDGWQPADHAVDIRPRPIGLLKSFPERADARSKQMPLGILGVAGAFEIRLQEFLKL